jgi:cell division cycle protein 20 (cofactor of APC complex)
VAATLDLMSLNPTTTSPGHTARLVAATGVPLNKRVLAYHEAPPAASDTTLTKQREIARPLYSRPGALPSSSGAVTNRSRKIATQPERVLDAPGMVDDFYLNLLSWSVQNVVAVALAENTYIWKADSGDVVQIGEAPEGTYVSSVDFSNDGSFLGIGIGSGDVELWDVESGQKLRSMGGHQAQIAVLSWHGHILSSACGDGSIWHHDVRVARHKVMELLGHSGEVCGLEWRADGELLASGGNDNVVNIWDGRVGDVTEGSRGVARWTKRNHSAAVKVLYHVFIFIQFLLFRTVSFSFFFFHFRRAPPFHAQGSFRPLFFLIGSCVVPMAAIPSGEWRRNERCHGPRLE